MKKKLAILCGGQSAEHEVSVISSKNIIRALDKNKYDVLVIYIHKNGGWYLFLSPEVFLNSVEHAALAQTDQCQQVSLALRDDKKSLVSLDGKLNSYEIDVVFPVLHGAHGEDGTMQGLLELANIPYIGPGVLSSAVCMDKDVSKRLLRAANIPTSNFLVVSDHDAKKLSFADVVKELGLPMFVKPANTGSSVGVSKVKNEQEFKIAVELALQFDHKIILEQFIAGREVECSVLGNGIPEASLPGEIITHHEFYTYEAKYIDPQGAILEIPAKFPEKVIKEIQSLAKKTYQTLCCEGMARVDFFVTPENKIYVNEANTIPGFTQISMYPKMWEASGLPYSQLLDKLIDLALERFKRNRVLVQARDFKIPA